MSKQALADGVRQINLDFEEKAALQRANAAGLSYIDLNKTPLNPDFLKHVSFEDSAKARAVVVYHANKKLRLATESTSNESFQRLLERFGEKGYEVEVLLASKLGVSAALKFYESSKSYLKSELVKEVDESRLGSYEKELGSLKVLEEKIGSMTGEEGLNGINIAAMKSGATDVHYEPEREFVNVRFRIDGVLYKVMSLSLSVYKNLVNQLKYESKIQINLDSVPQDGRYVFDYNDEVIAVRVSSLPTNEGESFVCRFLRTPKEVMGFEDLGFEGVYLSRVQSLKSLSNGMVLCTGPTGSGKTTTLYSLIASLDRANKKVVTLEDPVEYGMEGVVQSQINEKRGYDFENGLKSLLRQDPDVIMLGEIRDAATARAAIEAAMTGHVLLSTLHTNSAIDSVVRLVDLGIERVMIAAGLHTVIAQRLVRKVCAKCHKMRAVTADERKEFLKVCKLVTDVEEVPQEVVEVVGCEECSHTGYKGRMAIVEVLKVNEKVKQLILGEASTVKIIEAVREDGFITMHEDGLLKVMHGVTTFEEVLRAVQG